MRRQAGGMGWLIVGSLIGAWLAMLLWAVSAAAASIPARQTDHRTRNDDREAYLAAVRTVLAHRTAQPAVPQRIEDKLSALSDERLRLIGSLAERIADGKPSVATDVAFLLLTVLIVTP